MNTSNVAIVLISMLISYVYVFAFLFRTFKVDYYNPIVKTSVNWLEPIPNAIFFLFKQSFTQHYLNFIIY